MSKTVLLIDDDADFLKILTARCESIGLVVQQAHNLLTATMRVAENAPDILCVDVQTPTGSGLAFCESFAADRVTAHVPIIVLSGQSDDVTQLACARLGADYVPKTSTYWSILEPLLRQLAAETRPEVKPKLDVSPKPDPNSDTVLMPAQSPVFASSIPGAKKIVVLDDDKDILSLMSQRLSLLGCSVFGIDNAMDALNVIHRIAPDLVCVDVNMPTGNGLSICEMMASHVSLSKIPVIVLTGKSDESTIRRCHNMLVYYVQKKAGDTWQRMEPLVRELLHIDTPIVAAKPMLLSPPPAATSNLVTIDDSRVDLMDAVFSALGVSSDGERSSQSDAVDSSASGSCDTPPWVLCIDDDSEFADALKIRLEEHGVAVLRAYNGMEGYRLAFTSPANAILLDFNMPNGQGDYVLDRLKSNPVTADIPVIVISGQADRMVKRKMLSMGAAAYLEKPVHMDRLKAELAKYIDILEHPLSRRREKVRDVPLIQR